MLFSGMTSHTTFQNVAVHYKGTILRGLNFGGDKKNEAWFSAWLVRKAGTLYPV